MAITNEFDKIHQQEIDKLQTDIDFIYGIFVKEVQSLYGSIGTIPTNKPFDLNDYPQTQKRLEKMIQKLSSRVTTTIVNGVKSQWTLANNKNNELCNVVFGELVNSLTKEQKRYYYTNNEPALQKFLARKVGGMSISNRVWNYAQACIPQVESTLELGLKTGQSAVEMARDLKQYLKYPDKLFRRVRGADGELHLSKAAQNFHPGQGIYRSSYKNALRLAATENNLAYRGADHLRHTQLDFVVGIEIHLSNNHTLNGKAFKDICDTLAGRYPKWFDFGGWHPFCRCFVTTILKTAEEVKRDLDGVDRGSVNEVKELPPQFLGWLAENQERIDMSESRGTLPYFLRDNLWAWKEGVDKPWENKTTNAMAVAIQRHANRTPEQIADIKNRWHERYVTTQYAANVLRIAKSIPDWETYSTPLTKRIKILEEALRNGAVPYSTLETVAQNVKHTIQDIGKDFSTIPQPLKAIRQYGFQKVEETHLAVKKKMEFFESNSMSSDLSWMKKKLKFEIQWLEENKKHETWQLAQEAYKKALENVETQEFWQDFGYSTLNISKLKSRASSASRYDLANQVDLAYKKKDLSAMKQVEEAINIEYKWVSQYAFEKTNIFNRAQRLDKGLGTTYAPDFQNAFDNRDEATYLSLKNTITTLWEEYSQWKTKLYEYNEDTISKLAVQDDEAKKLYWEIDDFLDSDRRFNVENIKALYAKAEEFAKWGEIKKKYKQWSEVSTENTILRGVKPTLLNKLSAAILAKNFPAAQSIVSQADTLIAHWKEILAKDAEYVNKPGLPDNLLGQITDAEMMWNEPLIKAAWKMADEYLKKASAIDEFRELAEYDTTNAWYKKWIVEGQMYLDAGDLDRLVIVVEKMRKKRDELGWDGKIDKDAPTFKVGSYEDWNKYIDLVFEHDNKIYSTLTKAQIDAIWKYTDGSGPLNRPLSGQANGSWRFSEYVGPGKVALDSEGYNSDTWKLAQEGLSKCLTEAPMWLRHGGDDDQFEGIFGESLFTVSLWKEGYSARHSRKPKTEQEVQSLVGRTGVFEGFLSMSATKPWGKDILFNVYMPKGTEAMLVAPFSAFGGGEGGVKDYTTMDRDAYMGEKETLINQGYEYKILAIRRCQLGEWKWEVDMVALSRNKSYWKQYR